MKTKLNFNERQNLNVIKNQLALMHKKLYDEWINDIDKDGRVRLHTKTKKCLERTFRAFDDIMWLLNHMDIEM